MSRRVREHERKKVFQKPHKQLKFVSARSESASLERALRVEANTVLKDSTTKSRTCIFHSCKYIFYWRGRIHSHIQLGRANWIVRNQVFICRLI